MNFPLKILIVLLSFLLGFATGLYFNADFVKKLQRKINNPLHLYSNISEKHLWQRDAESEEILELLILGQSNAGNHGLQAFKTQGKVTNFWRGDYFRAEDPLLGGSSTGGSVWVRMADYLLAGSDQVDEIRLSVLTVDASSIQDWLSSSRINFELERLVKDLQSADAHIDYILWVQGERDNVIGTSQTDYETGLLQFQARLTSLMNRSLPLVVATSTFCRQYPASNRIAAAINILAKTEPARFIKGPSSDDLGWEYRYDGCHFSGEGQDVMAQRWAKFLEGLLREKIAVH